MESMPQDLEARPPTAMFDVTNAEQARAWDGDAGAYWASQYGIFEASLARYQPAFLGAAATQPGDGVLDIVAAPASRLVLPPLWHATAMWWESICRPR